MPQVYLVKFKNDASYPLIYDPTTTDDGLLDWVEAIENKYDAKVECMTLLPNTATWSEQFAKENSTSGC